MTRKNHEMLKVNKKHLIFVSGVMWSSIGISLLFVARNWLQPYRAYALYYIAGLFLALVIHTFGFEKIAFKNITRIKGMVYKYVHLFYFQSLKSYFLIVIMVSLGMYLRNSSIPKDLLAILYLGIGGGLFLSSFRYYRNYIEIYYINSKSADYF